MYIARARVKEPTLRCLLLPVACYWPRADKAHSDYLRNGVSEMEISSIESKWIQPKGGDRP